MKEKKVSDTAKPILAVKYVTGYQKPFFWEKRNCGNRKTPLSNNELANLFLSEEDIKNAETHPNIGNLKTVSIRERWINKLFHHFIKEHGYQQVVILGSGFDIRPAKKRAEIQKHKSHADKYLKVRFWEIDKPEILEEKEKIFLQKGLDKNATYIKGDYTAIDFVKNLIENGIDLQKPTLIIFEGNLMYLEKDQATAVFNRIQTSFKDCVIAFDYFPQFLIDLIVSKAPEGSNEKLWKTGINNLQDFAKQCGLKIIDQQSIGKLSKDYDVDNEPSDGANNYFVCALGNR